MQRRILLLIAAAVLAIGLAACSSSSKSASASSSSGTTPAAGAADITIKDFAFTTKPVKAGATVTVTNNGPSTHTVTSDDGKSFSTGNVDSGKTVTFTAPSAPGTYKFHCSIHTFMTGTLTVTA
jgi:plastocyanin